MSHNYISRHVGPTNTDIEKMLEKIGVNTVDQLIDNTIPGSIRLDGSMKLPEEINENEYLNRIREIAGKNKIYRSYIGMGYYNTILPSVIRRNIFENPNWYTSYTPYQAEISQGRLEALLNFQTMVMELTNMDIANASLLDEGSAAAEAMILSFNSRSRDAAKRGANKFFVDSNVFPQTIGVLQTRALNLGIELSISDYKNIEFDDTFFGALVQYPADDGKVENYSEFTDHAHQKDIVVTAVADLLSLSLLVPPGNWGADIVVGSTQRFGIPMGFGGPHAAYFASREKFKRQIPGRIIGATIDKKGKYALRMALQTREQHIKREKATSNICTAQSLLAIMAGMYAVYHGPRGLVEIATKIHQNAVTISKRLSNLGFRVSQKNFFDTINITLPENVVARDILIFAHELEINFRYFDEKNLSIALDETTEIHDLNDILTVFAKAVGKKVHFITELTNEVLIDKSQLRTDDFMKHELFNSYHSETEMMRYIKKLEKKDISLTDSMISLGSCTMKLNAATTLLPLGLHGIANLHPFAPISQTEGYQQIFYELTKDLKEITGFDGVSFQPNSGASGEYSGLIVVKEYHKSIGQENRNVVLIPASAHGTNPASAVMAGLDVVVVKCDENGNIDTEDLKEKTEQHKENLSSIMITYPSTHGVYEENILEITEIIHNAGGQVYMDGANMNAQVGLTNPAKIGADVCHLNLHKTFAIPHGGGGPGVGPICVAPHLTRFLPTHPVVETGGSDGVGPVSSAPWGSASILTISYAYIKMSGADGLTWASKMAILNSNYIAACLKKYYNILYTGKNDTIAHEMIIDCRKFKATSGVTEIDIAKRLIDYGFHAPTVSFPVHGTLMIEPTESESKRELDRFIDALVSIYGEIMEIEDKKFNQDENVLKNAPHSYDTLTSDIWEHDYSRQKAGFPAQWIRENKYWPPIERINDAHGDRNLVCSCPEVSSY